jgi:hypothetical protein
MLVLRCSGAVNGYCDEDEIDEDECSWLAQYKDDSRSSTVYGTLDNTCHGCEIRPIVIIGDKHDF